MEISDLTTMTGGWFVGDFKPTALATGVAEVAVKSYVAGDSEARHHHRVATEVTLVLSGTARFNETVVDTGQIATIPPGESVAFKAVTDVVTVVVKVPSVAGDKYPGYGPDEAPPAS